MLSCDAPTVVVFLVRAHTVEGVCLGFCRGCSAWVRLLMLSSVFCFGSFAVLLLSAAVWYGMCTPRASFVAPVVSVRASRWMDMPCYVWCFASLDVFFSG